MNSLKVKILGITILITVIAVAVAAWHNLQTQSLMVKQMVTQNSRILARTIHGNLTTAMQTGRNYEVIEALQKIDDEQSIHMPRIFDESGRILFSAEASEIGCTVPAIDLLTFRNNPDNFGLTSS